jgi:large subunit ribosomal protein L33
VTIGSVRPPRDSEVFIPTDENLEGAGSDEAPGTIASPRAVSGARVRSVPRDFDRRKRIVLACASCGGRNYRKTKARREGAAPIQLMKFCSTCNAHTQHREAV